MELDFKKVNLYELFDIKEHATESEIKKSYRKKALIYHPDKNPDNDKAKEIFQQLSKALEVLLDVNARAAYDKVWKTKQLNEARFKQQDVKRRRFKDELDRREKMAGEEPVYSAEEKLKMEIERIREQG